MLPALPTGRQCTSGASPSAWITSNAAVFCPSSRSGLTELTTATCPLAASLRTSSRQSSKLPSTCSSLAPYTSACASFPTAILPRGTSTTQSSPARAAYAAALALVFPVDAQITVRAPQATASETATVMPRSLNDPVGFIPSIFRYTWQPVSSDSAGAGSSGVPPSPSVTTASAGISGRLAENSPITPRQATLTRSFPLLTLDAQDAVDRAHGFHRPEVGDGVGERRLAGGMGNDDQLSVLPPALLVHSLDRHVPPGEPLGHRGEHPRPICHVKADVVPGQGVGHRDYRQLG